MKTIEVVIQADIYDENLIVKQILDELNKKIEYGTCDFSIIINGEISNEKITKKDKLLLDVKTIARNYCMGLNGALFKLKLLDVYYI